jgi:O-antigen/teichoic acid export membrane protein
MYAGSALNAARLVAFKTFSDLAGRAAMLLVLSLAARSLATADMASILLASTLGWLLSVATDFGLQLDLAREVARAPGQAGRALWPLLRRRSHLLALGLAVAGVISLVWLPLEAAIPFAGVAAGYLLGSMVEFLNHAYRALNRTDIEAWINLGQRLASLLLAWGLLLIRPAVSSVALALIMPPLVAIAVSRVLLLRMAPRVSVPAGDSVPNVFRRVAPIGAGLLLSALYFRVDVFLLDHWTGPEAVAQYGAVFRLMDALRILPAALLAVMLPQMFRGRDTALLFKISAGLTAFGVASAIAIYAAAPIVVTLAFGPTYAPAVPLFRILAVAVPLLMLNYGLTTQLIGWDGQRAFAVINAWALAANLAINTYLIPSMGAAGAAWATVATEVLLTVSCLYALRAARAVRQ